MKSRGRKTALVLLILLLLLIVAWQLRGTFDEVQVNVEPTAEVVRGQVNCAPRNTIVVSEATPEKREEANSSEAEHKPVAPTPPVEKPAEKPTALVETPPVPESPIQGPEPKEGEKYVIGRVVDGDTNEGVDAAQVFAATTRELIGTVSTNNKGRFRITGLPATNKIKLLARREGFLSPLDYVEVEIAFGLKPLPKHDPRETGTEPRAVFSDVRNIRFTWADLSASPVETVIRVYRSVQVQGRCQDEAGNPIKGAFVSAPLVDFGGYVEVRSGPGGEFSLGSFPGGRRTLEISASNAGKVWGCCTILELGYPARPWEVVITLRARASINCKFVPLDPNSKTLFLVQIKTEHSTYPGSSVNSPAWECGLNGFVEIGQRFMVVVVEMREPKLGMGPVVAQSDWIVAQQETEAVVYEQLRTRVEASLEGLGLNWEEIDNVVLTTGEPGSVTGLLDSIRVPGFGQTRTTVRCESLTTETSQEKFVVACRVNPKPTVGRPPLVFISEPMSAARGQTLAAILKPVSEYCGDVSVRVMNRNYGYAIVQSIGGGTTIQQRLSPDGDAGSATLKGLVAGVYRVWWVPGDNWKFAARFDWCKQTVVAAGEAGHVEITVPQ